MANGSGSTYRNRSAALLSKVFVIVILCLCTGHAVAQEPAETAASYLTLLEKAGDDLSEEEEWLVRRQVARMMLLLPERVVQRVVTGAVRTVEGRLREGWRIKPRAGKLLVAWWHAQDPLPGTPANERLEEHLERVAYAEAQYAAPTLSGWDDRGLVYVRLGAPSTQRSVRFSAPRLVRMLEKTSAPVRLQDFPENELWVYDEIAEHALYLFVEQDDRYTLASSEELVPRSLRLVSGRRTNVLVQEPPPAKTDVLLEAMRTLYGELAPYHPDFAQAYLDVAAYLDAELPGKTASEPSYRAESEIRRPIHLYAIARLSDTRVKEASATARREEVVPRQRSKVLAGVRPFPVSVRTARFLDAEGSTRTEIYWSVPAAGLSYWAFQRFLVEVTTVQRNADYTPRSTQRHRQIVRTAPPVGSASVLPSQTLTVQGDTAMYHVAVQWDQYPLISTDTTLRKASPQPVRRGVFRADSLQPLHARPGMLEMSDLVPIVVSGELDLDRASGKRPEIHPYPFPMIAEGDSLGVYFEVYHLAFGTDDQTHVVVEYEVRLREEGGLFRLFRDRLQRTSARTRYVGHTRTTREWILLDVGAWEEADELDVVVRVTDETTGQVAERSVRFGSSRFDF